MVSDRNITYTIVVLLSLSQDIKYTLYEDIDQHGDITPTDIQRHMVISQTHSDVRLNDIKNTFLWHITKYKLNKFSKS